MSGLCRKSAVPHPVYMEDWASAGVGAVVGIAGLFAGLWTAGRESRNAAERLQQERHQFDVKLQDERSRFERELSEATRRAEVELAEQRSQRLADRRAAVYVDLTRFLLAEDAKIYDNDPIGPVLRAEPLEMPSYGDSSLDVQLRAFASEDVLRLVDDWRTSIAIVVKLMTQIRQSDPVKQIALKQERSWSADASHATLREIFQQVRLELSPQPPGD